MKISNDTLTVLKNFVGINASIEFKKGNKLATISPTKTVLAKATISDKFPQDFCVHDLNQFLSVHSLYKDCDLDFDEHHVIFKSGKRKTKYRTTSRNVIVTVPEKELTLPSVDATFTLTAEDLANIVKTCNVLQSPNISVESDGEKISVTSFDANDDSAHVNSTEICDGNGTIFKAVFLAENLKMMPDSYSVEISSKGLASFKNTKGDLQYWIAIESKHSKFGE
jgi:hypothetical protein